MNAKRSSCRSKKLSTSWTRVKTWQSHPFGMHRWAGRNSYSILPDFRMSCLSRVLALTSSQQLLTVVRVKHMRTAQKQFLICKLTWHAVVSQIQANSISFLKEKEGKGKHAVLPWYWEGDSDGRLYLCFLPSFQSMAETRNKAFMSVREAS